MTLETLGYIVMICTIVTILTVGLTNSDEKCSVISHYCSLAVFLICFFTERY